MEMDQFAVVLFLEAVVFVLLDGEGQFLDVGGGYLKMGGGGLVMLSGVEDEEGEGFGLLFEFGLDGVEIEDFFIGLDKR